MAYVCMHCVCLCMHVIVPTCVCIFVASSAVRTVQVVFGNKLKYFPPSRCNIRNLTVLGLFKINSWDYKWVHPTERNYGYLSTFLYSKY